MISLRGRLTFATVATSALVFLLTALLTYFMVRRALFAEFDRSLDAKVRGLASLVEIAGGLLEVDILDRMPPEFAAADRPEYFQLWMDEGRTTIVKSPTLGERNLPFAAGLVGQLAHQELELPDGRHGRSATFSFIPPEFRDDDEEDAEDDVPATTGAPPPVLTLSVTAATSDIDLVLTKLAWLLTVVALVGVGVLTASQAVAVRLGLKPIDGLQTAITRLEAQDLSARLDDSSGPSELRPFASALNDLLERLETAFVRERAFTSDVAHELRTPVAGLCSQLDVALTRDRDTPQYQQVLRTCVRIGADMRRLIECLLTVARLDSGSLAVARQRVGLAAALEDCWTRFDEIARARGLRVDWDVDETMQLDIDPQHLRLIASNLFDNAVSHSGAEGAMLVQTRARADGVTLSVRNSGSLVAAGDASRVFDRLWRGTASRERGDLHSGLGLTIVQKLVILNGGRIHVTTDVGDDFIVIIEFPITPGASQATAAAGAATSRAVLVR